MNGPEILRSMKKETALLLVCISFTLHNLEEGIFMKDWIVTHWAQFPSYALRFIPQKITSDDYQDNFIVALVVVTAIFLALAVGVHRQNYYGAWLRCMILVSCLLLINAIQHIAVSTWLMAYSPGVVTAIALNFPINMIFLKRQIAERVITRAKLLQFFFISCVLYASFGYVALRMIQ